MLARGKRATLRDGRVVDGSRESNGFVDLRGKIVPAGQIERLDDRPYLLVTQEFRQLRGYAVGDDFELEKPGTGLLGRLRGEPVTFTIVGVVRSPGLDVMVTTFDLGREFAAESAASVFGTLGDAREIFGVSDVLLVAANLVPGVDKEKLVARLTETLGDRGIAVADVRQLKAEIQGGLRDLVAVAGAVAWAAMAVASLGVTNTIMAGVRSRQYQLGILRAIGVTRGELLRLVLAEAVLLGLAAAVLGVLAGLTMSLNARRLQGWMVGYVPELRIAWDIVGYATAAVVLVSLLAAIWPAWSAARRGVLSMLQAGRAAA